jgi:predicted ATP-dependent serine protease
MVLRAVEPGEVEKYPKILIFGDAGTGKSHNLCQFPRAYYFDLERGVEEKQYVEMLRAANSRVFPTTDIDELITEVTSLLSEQHDFKSVVIDPITPVFLDESDLQEKYVGTDYGKNVAEATKKWRRLGKLLKRLQMTVVVSAYEKAKFGSDGVMTAAGPKDIQHFFDVVLRAEKRGGDRVVTVVKSRNRGLQEGATFAFTFDDIAERYGREAFERDAVAVPLATADQVSDLARLLSMRTDGDALKDKWLKKVGAEELSELPADAAAKCLLYLKGSEKTEAA